jgi:RND family efflux transporter MFP subunit
MMRVVIVVLFVLAATASGAALFVARDPGESAPKLLPPTVTATLARQRAFVERLFVAGTLVARDEAMVGAQIDGLRIVEVLAEDGDRVEKGQILARLDRSQLDGLLAQNDAAVARADAAIAQARNQVEQSEAIRTQAAADLLRARKLEPGIITQATLDQRVAAARSTEAQVAAAESALAVANADKRSREAERRELMVRVDRTDVRAPVAGLVSRRSARLGALAVGSGDPLFRIVTDGAIELEADVPEDSLAELALGMGANVDLPGSNNAVSGTVRLVSSEVDQTTRLGKVRIALAAQAHIGSFASASIVLARRTSVAVPAAAVAQTGSVDSVLVVHDGHIEQRTVTTGLTNDTETEITAGIAVGEAVVVRAAAFLRNGDAVRAVASDQHREAAK